MVDLRINETLQTGAVRKPHLPFSRLVGTVSNCAYAVRLGNRTYRGRKCLFIFRIHHIVKPNTQSNRKSSVGFHYIYGISIRINPRNPSLMLGVFHWFRSTQPTILPCPSFPLGKRQLFAIGLIEFTLEIRIDLRFR